MANKIKENGNPEESIQPVEGQETPVNNEIPDEAFHESDRSGEENANDEGDKRKITWAKVKKGIKSVLIGLGFVVGVYAIIKLYANSSTETSDYELAEGDISESSGEDYGEAGTVSDEI